MGDVATPASGETLDSERTTFQRLLSLRKVAFRNASTTVLFAVSALKFGAKFELNVHCAVAAWGFDEAVSKHTVIVFVQINASA